jgi:hypothetical protein
MIHAIEEHIYAHQLIEKLFITLPPREERVLRLRFGLDGIGEHTRKEIAEDLGRSTTLAEILEFKALRKLKRRAQLDGRLELGPFPKHIAPRPRRLKVKYRPPTDWRQVKVAGPPPIEGEDYWRRDARMNGGGGYRFYG